jgi:hypothetical protein
LFSLLLLSKKKMGNQGSSSTTIPPSLPIVSNETTPTTTDQQNIAYLNKKTLTCNDSSTDYCSISKAGIQFPIGAKITGNDSNTGMVISGIPTGTATADGTSIVSPVRIDNFIITSGINIGGWNIQNSGDGDLCFVKTSVLGIQNSPGNQKAFCLSTTKDNIVSAYQNSNGQAPYFYLSKTGGYGISTT